MLVEYRNDMGGGLEEGFTLSEFGVMAKVGDDAPALLYYAALGDRAQPVPPANTADKSSIHVRQRPSHAAVAIGVTGEVEVSLEYPAGVWVTHEELEEALAGIDLSGYIKATEKGAPNGVATLGQDGKLVQDVDGGTWDTDRVETHNGAALAHANLRVDGNSTATEDASATLEEHMVNPMAHQNLVIDGNAGK